MTALLWLRRDLRVHDHPALHAALAGGDELLVVFCFDDRLLYGRHRSGPRTKFLLQCLADLNRSLQQRGGALVLRRGAPERVLPELARQARARSLHFSADVGPFARRRDRRVAAALRAAGVETHAHPGLFAIDRLDNLATDGGRAYSVFTPFHRAWRGLPRREVLPAPSSLPPGPAGVESDPLPELAELGLTSELREAMPGGEHAGREAMRAFLDAGVDGYGEQRNELAGAGGSRLSPYLHLGCLSARELESRLGQHEGANAYRRQLCWRDFHAYVLFHSPRNARSEYQQRYRGTLRWSHAEARFAAWCQGRTGFPLVDAAMRQLAREGWLPNRSRLVAGSFLTKDLWIDWRWGERWFMRLLLDGDQASNNGNWQWIASVGVDPQPPFRRMFNPARQQARFDSAGAYVRRYVAELRDVPDAYLAEPWTMPTDVQQQARCHIGADYPEPIVDHAAARRRALERFAAAG